MAFGSTEVNSTRSSSAANSKRPLGFFHRPQFHPYRMLLRQYNPVTASMEIAKGMEIAKLMEINEEVTVAVGETVAIRAVIRAAIKVRVDIKTRVGIRGNSRTAKNRFCRRCSD